mmetsp:Transcript_63837/g.183361  ORF Transcript_63837/g.183361 Transcript_63837/m.183361 type:complete len:112 (+) Transcript_63837:61-396(+)
MALRSRSLLAPVLVAVCALLALAPCFVPPQQQPALRGGEQALLASLAATSALPSSAMAASPEALDLDSSVAVAGTVEPLMMGIVMGCVPITIFGLFVAAWLQFKKGPTLGV